MKKTIFLFILVVFTKNLNAQNTPLKKANKEYENLAYSEAITKYEQAVANGVTSIDLYQNLGNAYFFNGKLKEANKWYAKLFVNEQDKKVENEYYYKYSQTLKAVGDYNKANEYLDQFHALAATDIRGNYYNNTKNYLDIIALNSGRYDVKNMKINSKSSDYGVAFYGDKIIYSSAKDTTGFAVYKTKWTNKAFTDFFVAQNDAAAAISEKFSKNINSKFNEDSPVFTKDLKTIYFTRNNYINGKKGTNDSKEVLLKIYKATLNNGKWDNITALPFNSDQYNVAHPALSNDEKTLYFASDMPGTKGQSDIYKVSILDNGTFGTPTNLAGGINTESRETFPYISANNELYFASDGHPGLGGLDVFVAQLDSNGNPKRIVNVGAPVNTNLDDFNFIIDSNSKKGYLSSNRENGVGNDDIYSLFEKTPLNYDFKHILEGDITDKDTGLKINNSTVVLLDANKNEIARQITDKTALYKFDVTGGKTYYVKAENTNYNANEVIIAIPATDGTTNLPVTLSKLQAEPLTVGSDVLKLLELKNIYFDLDKYQIRKDAALELQKVVVLMKSQPDLKIKVLSHTDSRQTARYNLALSQKRAFSTVNWIVKNGISADRISGIGLGESSLINNCKDGFKCTEQEHEKNRRSEFIILEL